MHSLHSVLNYSLQIEMLGNAGFNNSACVVVILGSWFLPATTKLSSAKYTQSTYMRAEGKVRTHLAGS
jgi:hypothetical protein